MPNPRWILLFLSLSCFFISPVQAESDHSNHFYFVQITDTHLGDRDHQQRTQKVIDDIKRLPMPIACVVHTGDIMMDVIDDDTEVAKGLALFNQLEVPIHYVSGNHDILQRDIDLTHEAYTKHFGPLISQTEYQGVVFVFVYTEPLRKGFHIDGYQPLQALEERLRQTNGKPVIVFHHAPSVNDFYNNRFHGGWDKPIQEKWQTLINAYNVKAVISGHFHRDEHHWLKQVPLYVSASVASYWGRQATYRIYEYRDGKISYRTQYIR